MTSFRPTLFLAAALVTLRSGDAWQVGRTPPSNRLVYSTRPTATALNARTENTETPFFATLNNPAEESGPSAVVESTQTETSAETTTEKYGLEAGLFQSLRSNDGESAKSLLKKYGIAYLATSIPLAIVSFAICYFLVDAGVDVSALLAKVGIENAATEKAGTFAIAYAAHKAASPIRFPPTVILTPVVAKIIGKEPEEDVEDEASDA